jgi:hypothetical protein
LLISIIYWPVPTFRYLASFLQALQVKYRATYPLDPAVSLPGKELYQHHIDFVKRTVPPSRLYFFDVKEGWEPLCKILDVPVPDEPFPCGNDAKAMEELGKVIMMSAACKWAQILGGGALVACAGLFYLL